MKNQQIKTSLAKLESLISRLKIGGEEKKLWKEIKNYWQKRSLLTVKVISAVPLAKDELKTIENKVNGYLNVPFRVENIIKPNILGGLKIQIAEKVFDATIVSYLETLKPLLKNSFNV